MNLPKILLFMALFGLHETLYCQLKSNNQAASEQGPKESRIPNVLLKYELLSLNKGKFKGHLFEKYFNFRFQSDQAFFCKMEEKNFLSSQIPLRIRLGDLDYANHLEGKGQGWSIIKK